MLMGNFSRSYTDMQVEMIARKPELFELYWQVYKSLDGPEVGRAAWVISHAVLKMPHLASPAYLREMLDLAPKMMRDSEKRNLAKVLTIAELPEELHGEILDLCFTWLADTSESIAVRAYCMETLLVLSREIPEIKGELCAIIENNMDRFSAGLQNKGHKTLQAIHRSESRPHCRSNR